MKYFKEAVSSARKVKKLKILAAVGHPCEQTLLMSLVFLYRKHKSKRKKLKHKSERENRNTKVKEKKVLKILAVAGRPCEQTLLMTPVPHNLLWSRNIFSNCVCHDFCYTRKNAVNWEKMRGKRGIGEIYRKRRGGKCLSVSISPLSLHFITLSPVPLSLHFLIFSPFPHSLPISSQPGCQAAAGCDSLELSLL